MRLINNVLCKVNSIRQRNTSIASSLSALLDFQIKFKKRTLRKYHNVFCKDTAKIIP